MSRPDAAKLPPLRPQGAGEGRGGGGAGPPIPTFPRLRQEAAATSLSIRRVVLPSSRLSRTICKLLPLLLVGTICQATCAAADKVYFFVDERGVAHFSNVPHDPRYRALMNEIVLAPRFDEEVAPLALDVSVPAVVAKGGVFEVSIAIPGSPAVRGQIELVFDPAALVFDEATADYDLVDPGRLRLDVDPGIASAFAADVRFAVRRDAPDQTVLRSGVVDLESEERIALRGVAAEPVVIRLAPGRP